MNPPSPCGQPESRMPGKIEAALDFCRFARTIQVGEQNVISGVTESSGRALDSSEKRAYDAALACLTEFFNSDEELAAHSSEPPPPDDPKEKVPVS